MFRAKMTSHKTALWRQKRTESYDWRTTVGRSSAPHVVASAVDEIQPAAAVRVRGERHLARAVADRLRDVIAGSDVTSDVSVNGREVYALLGVGVGKAHRLPAACRAGTTQDGAAAAGTAAGSEAGSLQPLWHADRLQLTGAGWQFGVFS